MMGPMFPGMRMFFGWPWLLVFPLAAALFLIAFSSVRARARPGREARSSTPARGQRAREIEILRLAAKNGGVLTVSDVAMETGLPISRAEGALDKMVDGHRVSLRVSDSGVVLYEFLEITARKDRNDE